MYLHNDAGLPSLYAIAEVVLRDLVSQTEQRVPRRSAGVAYAETMVSTARSSWPRR